MLIRCLSVLIILLAVLLSGCGGGNNLGAARGTGSVAVAFRWPAPTRVIPTSAESLVVTITYPNEYCVSKTVNRPTTALAGTTEQVEFFGLLTGPATLEISAYSGLDGTGLQLAFGAAALNIQPGRHANVSLTLASVPSVLNLSGPYEPIKIGDTPLITATAYDALESMILLPDGAIEWNATPASVATISADGVLTAVSDGTVTVTATIKNTTISDTLTVRVQPLAMVPAPTVASVADATALSETFGATNISWPAPPTNVVAVLLYRTSHPGIPLAILEPTVTSYLDSSKVLPDGGMVENTAAQVTIDPLTGSVLGFTKDVIYDTTPDNLMVVDQTLTADTFSVTCRRIQLTPGIKSSYQLRWLYRTPSALTMQGRAATTASYQLALSAVGPTSMQITTIMPPILITEESIEPTDGNYQCVSVNGANEYTLQVSTYPDFSPAKSINVDHTASPTGPVMINLPLANMDTAFSLTAPTTIYWRMGARVTIEPRPIGFNDPNCNDWVYSETRNYYHTPLAFFTRRK
jgi:hypothetical protein